MAFFPVLANTTLGLNSIDRNLADLFALYGASRGQVLWNLKLPSALPYILGAGLGIRRARVAGQLFPGMISVFHPIDAAAEAVGMPTVVFADNVGDDAALAQAVAILNGQQEDR